jgi:hypothetical protein
MLFAIAICAAAIVHLSFLLLPKEKREQYARWGRSGKGGPMSLTVIIGYAGFYSALAAIIIGSAVADLSPAMVTGIEGLFLASGCIIIVGVIHEALRKKPNQTSEPTAASGRGSL